MLRKRYNLVSAVHLRVKKRIRKYGILIPTSVEEAYAFDKQD